MYVCSLFVDFLACLFICLFACLFACLLVCVCVFVCLFVGLFAADGSLDGYLLSFRHPSGILAMCRSSCVSVDQRVPMYFNLFPV